MKVELNCWKVGELARITGLTVRTLHHYEEIGLLTPSHSTDNGHRLYSRNDLERLQQIVALKHFGFSLDQVRDAICRPDFSPIRTIQELKKKVENKILELGDLAKRLESVEQTLSCEKEISSKSLIELIERIAMFEKYLTKEQIEKTNRIEKEFSPERLEKMVKHEWPILIREVQEEMNQGTLPSDPKVQTLAKRWMKLVDEKTAGDRELAARYPTIFEKEPAFAAETSAVLGNPGADLPKMIQYMKQALKTPVR